MNRFPRPWPRAAPDTAALRAERDGLLARLQRLSADYLNYQKRVAKDITEAREYGNANLIRDLLVVLDELDLAIAHASTNHPQDDPLLVGCRMVGDKALEVLGRYGLTP